jgi:CPA1 family monovalent cation:H+ antiporter
MDHLAHSVLLAFGLLAVATLAYGLFRRSALPFTVVLVLVGVALRESADLSPSLAFVADLRLEPGVVFFLLLPALIFESAYNLHGRHLLKDLVPILVLAVPALVASALLIGLGLWQWAALALPTALLFGALISATDPVAVVSLFRELGAPRRLTVLVEGESLLNDGTALVLFKILLAAALAGSMEGLGLGEGVLAFLRVALGGALVGAVLALMAAHVMRRLGGDALVATALTILIAYLGFVVAEHFLHLSGVIAAVAGGLVLGQLAPTAMLPAAREQVSGFWELAAYVSNSLLFLLLGLSMDLASVVQRGPVILGAIALVLASRALLVYTLVPLATRRASLGRLAFGYRTVIFWGGLKGGLAVAMVLSLPEAFPARDVLLDLTLGVVLFTLLVNATTIRPLMRALELDLPSFRDRLEHQWARGAMVQAGHEHLAGLNRDGYISAGAADHATRLLGNQCLETEGWGVRNPEPDQMRLYYMERALWLEVQAYQALYEQGVVPELVVIELKASVAERRERLAPINALPEEMLDPEAFYPGSGKSLLAGLEAVLVRLLRRASWLDEPLSRLQSLRLAQEVEWLLAASLAAQRVIDTLEDLPDEPARQDVQALYRRLDERLRAGLAALNHEFPDFADWLEQRLAARSALRIQSALLEHMHARGELADKPYRDLCAQLDERMQALDVHHGRRPHQRRTPLVRSVPLFADLGAAEVMALADAARMLYYLPGDAVLEPGDAQQALYVVESGQVEVQGADGTRTGVLDRGDAFGAESLLRPAAAEVRLLAVTPATLLHLHRRAALEVAERFPAVRERLTDVAGE